MHNSIKIMRVAIAIALVVSFEAALAGNDCNLGPSIEITTPDEVCFGTNLRQKSSHPGEDGVPRENCQQCSWQDIDWAPNGNGPGYVDLSVSIAACNGTDSDSKTVAVVAPVDVNGQDHACATEQKTYTVTTQPAGHYSLITWFLIKDGNALSSGAGQSFSPTFPEAGYYTVEAKCDSATASKGVNVGTDPAAPESVACDDDPSVPAPSVGTYSKIVTPFFEWYDGTWSLSFSLKDVTQSSIGACGQQAHTGVINQQGGWTLNAAIDAKISFFNISVGLSYKDPGTLNYSGFGAGGTDGIKYKVKAAIIEGTFSYSGQMHLKDLTTQRIRHYPQGDSDTYSASDLLPIICRWCCS